MTVYSSGYVDNAAMIAAAAELFIPDGAMVADVTWGKGAFWAKTDVDRFKLYRSDLHPQGDDVAELDFRALPYESNSFHTVVLDPPYAHNPGKHVTDARYNNAATTGGMYHHNIIDLYHDGMHEARRVLQLSGGRLWVKCKDEVEASKQCWSHIELYKIALGLGFFARDLFVIVPTSRTTSNRWKVQHHARKVHSYLWIFETGTPPKGVKRK